MTHKNVYQKLGYRVSEEVQLLAEEKWILDALTKIKNQRNCLQIERLQLESLKSKLKINPNKDAHETIRVVDENSVATSAVNLMQIMTSAKSEIEAKKDLIVDDAACNDEELNLMVTKPVFDQCLNTMDYNMEEDEEESDDDMLIDMNMLMNGKVQECTHFNTEK